MEATSLTVDEPENKVQLYKDFNEKSHLLHPVSVSISLLLKLRLLHATTFTMNTVMFLETGGYNESDVDQTLVDYQNALDEAGYQDILSEIRSV